MATIVFYEKPGCANNARQKTLLAEAGHRLIVRDLLSTPWTAELLRAFFQDRPVAEWFNRAAPRVKSGEVDPESLVEESALALMLEDHLLIRRPLLQVGAQRQVGFELERIQAWLGTFDELDSSDEASDLERCVRAQHCPAPKEAP